MISTKNARKKILENLRSSLGETEIYSDDEEYKQPELRREQTKDYDGYDEEEEEEKVYMRPKTRERKIPRRLRTPERKPEKKKRTNNKLVKFNECLRKLKTENPNMSHREAQKNMRQILNQLNANGDEDPETTFMKMTKN